MIPVADPGLTNEPIRIRPVFPEDEDALWAILQPVIRAGETYTLPRDMPREKALAFWLSPSHEVFVAEQGGEILGTYFLRPNQQGGGSHVANCGYVISRTEEGRGIARAVRFFLTARVRQRSAKR